MDLMIDLETLDTIATSAIVTVGVCAFDRDGIHDRKEFLLDVQEQLEQGRTVDFGTLEWWFRQKKEVTDAAFNRDEPKYSIAKFIEKFGYFCAKNNIQKPWAQGTDFDLAMISHLHKTNKAEVPYQFYLARDVRTFCDGMVKPKREGNHHNAVDDAVYQAECVIQVMKDKL